MGQQFSPDQSRRLKHFVGVDNLGVHPPDREVVENGLDDICENVTAKQTFLHPGEVQHNPIKALGVRLDGEHLS